MSVSRHMKDHAELTALAATAAAITAAAQTGLLAMLDDDPQPAERLAERLALDAFATTAVLDVLVQLELAERTEAGYRGSRMLLGERRGPAGDVRRSVAMWSTLPEFMRHGRGHHFHGRQLADREAVYRQAVSGLASLFTEPARGLADALAACRPAAMRILDVGAGSGVWSLAMAAPRDGVITTALDLPDVLAAFTARARSEGLQDRVATIAGDYHDVEIPRAAFDRIVFANVLHLEQPDHAAALLSRLVHGLAPGGDIVVIDAMSDGSRDADRFVAAYALSLALRSGAGRPHPESQLRAWLHAAGLSTCERIAVPHALPGIAALVAWR